MGCFDCRLWSIVQVNNFFVVVATRAVMSAVYVCVRACVRACVRVCVHVSQLVQKLNE